MIDEPLREVAGPEQTGCLLQALRRDFPQSIHMLNRVLTQQRWREQGLDDSIRIGIYRGADEGDSPDGYTTVLSVMYMDGHREPTVSLHTTDPSCEALRRVLAHSAFIPWDEDFIWESVHERCIPILEAEMTARMGTAPVVYPTDKVMLPKEVGIKLRVGDAPPGLCLRNLEPKHGKFVNDNWPYGHPGAEHMLAQTIARNPGLSWGVFREDDLQGDPVAFVLGTWYGGVGILHTMDSHRRMGLGELVIRAASESLARLGLDNHGNIVMPNPASVATFAKVGFTRVCVCAWVDYKAPKK